LAAQTSDDHTFKVITITFSFDHNRKERKRAPRLMKAEKFKATLITAHYAA
jgi:hypothetical protein